MRQRVRREGGDITPVLTLTARDRERQQACTRSQRVLAPSPAAASAAPMSSLALSCHDEDDVAAVEQQVGIDGVVLRDRSDRRSRLQAALYEFALERLIVFAATDPAGPDSLVHDRDPVIGGKLMNQTLRKPLGGRNSVVNQGLRALGF
jgi:hypothetical protein